MSESLGSKWEHATYLGPRHSCTNVEGKMDREHGRFPYCIVWTPLPLITWFIPFIGHIGICDSRGVCYDFAGSHYIGIDDLAFGSAQKFVPLDVAKVSRMTAQPSHTTYDNSIDAGNDIYECRTHNIFLDNCHSHVAECLNRMRYANKSNWNMVRLFFDYYQYERVLIFIFHAGIGMAICDYERKVDISSIRGHHLWPVAGHTLYPFLFPCKVESLFCASGFSTHWIWPL